jgi:hypothetical protein
MTKYKWDNIDELYKWVAMDSDGTVMAYRERPILKEIYWDSSGGGMILGYLSPWQSSSDWKESLEERPKPPKRYELMDSGVIFDREADNWLALVEVMDRLNYYEELQRK